MITITKITLNFSDVSEAVLVPTQDNTFRTVIRPLCIPPSVMADLERGLFFANASYTAMWRLEEIQKIVKEKLDKINKDKK